MDIKYSKDEISFEKELNDLDRFTIKFTSLLDEINVRYVLISGYVSILFGRSRSSEDIDIIIEKMDFTRFMELWEKINESFTCIITKDPKEAYDEYINDHHAIRFAIKDSFIPNMEVKFPKIELESWALQNRKKVIVNNKSLFISPLELQISFKLYLGSEKDIEDAKHIYELFKDKLDLELLNEFNRNLNIEETFNKYIK